MTQPPTRAEVEAAIRSHSIPAIGAQLPPDGFVFPNYAALSVANLPATLASVLGAPFAGSPPVPAALWSDLADGVRQVAWLTLDGLGWLDFAAWLSTGDLPAFAHLAEAGRLYPLTSVFPSTTSAAYLALWTGRTPAEHGSLAYYLYLREFGAVCNMIELARRSERRRDALLDEGLDPARFLGVPGLAEQLAAGGVSTDVLIPYPFIGTGFSSMAYRGTNRALGYVHSPDMWVQFAQMLAEHPGDPGRPRLVAAYWPGLDSIAHYHGPDHLSLPAAARALDFGLGREFLAGLGREARDGTLLVVTADHGLSLAANERGTQLSTHPALRVPLLHSPAGEARAAFLHLPEDQIELARSYIAGRLSERFVALRSQELLQAGLFGPGAPHPETPHRVGSLTLLARSDAALLFGGEGPMRGRHGGMSPAEMMVPLLMVRLDG